MRRGLAVCTIAVALTSSACGGTTKSGLPVVTKLSPVAYVRHAATRTAAAPSEHIVMKGTVSTAEQTTQLDAQGDADNVKRFVSLSMRFSAGGNSGSMDAVLQSTDMYLKSSAFSGSIPDGKTWVKIDMTKAGKAQSLNLSTMWDNTPADTLARLQASGTVTKVGEETIDNAPTTHYRVQIDRSKLSAKLKKLEVTYGPVDVWIGTDDGYVHRMTMTSTTGAPWSQASLEMDFSNFGEAVSLDVPAQSDVYDITALALKAAGH